MPGRPVVALTAARLQASWGAWDREAVVLATTYVDAVAAAGGLPLVVAPPVDAATDGADVTEWAAGVVGSAGALVLTGGGDVDPACYGGVADGHLAGVLPGRDAAELALAVTALRAGLPVLAICRGMQVLNVALGGDLVSHVPDVVGNDAHRRAPGIYGAVDVQIAGGSLAGRLLGSRASVPCSHHQAVGRLGEGLIATAWAEDGLVEAVERPGDGFVLGVQWHPEERDGAALFEAVVAAASAEVQRP